MGSSASLDKLHNLSSLSGYSTYITTSTPKKEMEESKTTVEINMDSLEEMGCDEVQQYLSNKLSDVNKLPDEKTDYGQESLDDNMIMDRAIVKFNSIINTNQLLKNECEKLKTELNNITQIAISTTVRCNDFIDTNRLLENECEKLKAELNGTKLWKNECEKLKTELEELNTELDNREKESILRTKCHHFLMRESKESKKKLKTECEKLKIELNASKKISIINTNHCNYLIRDNRRYENECKRLEDELNSITQITLSQISECLEPNMSKISEYLESKQHNLCGICIICYDNKTNIMFEPCNHHVVCSDCSKNVNKCPICRKDILKKTVTFS